MLKYLPMYLTMMVNQLHQMLICTTNDDELEYNNNVFNSNDETMSEQQAENGKDEGYKMAAAADSNRPAENQSLLSANNTDEFAVDLNRILNICDAMEVNYIVFY